MKIIRKKIVTEIFWILWLMLISVAISYFFNGKALFESFDRFIRSFSYGLCYGLLYWKGSKFLGKYTGKRFRWTKNPMRANSIAILLFASWGTFVSFAVPFLFFKYVFDIPGINYRNLIFTGLLGTTLYLAFMGMFYPRYLAKYWMETLKNEERLKQENLIAKYEALKNQVNPHFLFNTLNTLTGIVEKDSKLATKYIKKLADTYRYVLEQKDKETVPISVELKFIDDYIYLQKIRYGDGLSFNSDISSLKGLVAPLSLQILVENAIKHNEVSIDHPLSIELEENNVYYILKNNLQKKKVIRENSGTGLDNLIKRYEYLSSNKVDIVENEKEFIVKIPKIELKES